MLQHILTNWKTTSAGIVAILGSVIHLIFSIKAGSANENTWTIVITAVLTGVGLIFAGDAGASATKVETEAIKTAVVTGDTSILKKTDTKP